MSSADGELLPPSTACRQNRAISDGAQVDITISNSDSQVDVRTIMLQSATVAADAIAAEDDVQHQAQKGLSR